MIRSFLSACFKFIGISKNLAGRTEHGVIWFGFGLGLSSLSLSLHCWNIHIPHIGSFLYRVDVKYTNHLTMQRKDVMQPLLSWERWIRHRTECQMSPGMTPVAILARMQIENHGCYLNKLRTTANSLSDYRFYNIESRSNTTALDKLFSWGTKEIFHPRRLLP